MAQNPSSTFTLSLPGDREILSTRIFDAPRELVFKAYTDPRLIERWWGPRRYTTRVEKLELKPGGAWRFLNIDADGTEYAFRGEFREVVPPERIVWTFEFEGAPGQMSIDTVTFEEQDGRTKMTSRSVFDSPEGRDGMVQAGMEEGYRESLDRLDEVLAQMEPNRR